jgi:DNA-binding NarL/FixJ family response regulator
MDSSSNHSGNGPRILIADDHALFRQILTLSLEDAGMEVIATAGTGRQAVERTLEHNPDCLLLDVALPEMDGLAALSVIKYVSPNTPVLIMTALSDPVYMARAKELGAEGFFTKSITAADLIASIKRLYSRQGQPGVFVRTSEPPPPSIPDPEYANELLQPTMAKDLTEQENIVLSLVAMGLTNPAIQTKLNISKNTVKTHMRNIFSKLGVTDRTQAAIWALHNGYGAVTERLN